MNIYTDDALVRAKLTRLLAVTREHWQIDAQNEGQGAAPKRRLRQRPSHFAYRNQSINSSRPAERARTV